jgi:hypothetical protein
LVVGTTYAIDPDDDERTAEQLRKDPNVHTREVVLDVQAYLLS